MKTMFILALLVLAATSAFAQMDSSFSQGHWGHWQEQPWQQQMTPCREFLRQQCGTVAAPFMRSQTWQASSCQVMRQQCCQQLAQIPEQSRCQAICSMAQAILQPQQQLQGLYQPQVEVMRTALETLPAMCGLYVPAYCTANTCSSIAAAAACAGGACY